MNAIALNAASMNVTRVIGPALGGILVAVVGAGWVYVLMAVLFLWSGLSTLTMQLEERRIAKALHVRSNGLSELFEGARYIMREPVILTILATDLIIVMLSMPYQFMLPGFADEVLGGGAGTLGILLMMVGIGSLIGSLTMASTSMNRRGFYLLVSALIMGVSLVGLSASTMLPLSLIAMLGIGLGQAGRMSIATVLLQSYTAPEYRGRVMSVFMIEFSLMMACTYAVGELANVIGVQWALGAMASLLVVYVIYAYFFLPRIRNLA
jgi:predicted MFS family arabinose efflux permease